MLGTSQLTGHILLLNTAAPGAAVDTGTEEQLKASEGSALVPHARAGKATQSLTGGRCLGHRIPFVV